MEVTMKYITAYYVDAKDRIPANRAALRHGPAEPCAELTIAAVDRRQTPPLIIGTVPDTAELGPGMTMISESEYDKSPDTTIERLALSNRYARVSIV